MAALISPESVSPSAVLLELSDMLSEKDQKLRRMAAQGKSSRLWERPRPSSSRYSFAESDGMSYKRLWFMHLWMYVMPTTPSPGQVGVYRGIWEPPPPFQMDSCGGQIVWSNIIVPPVGTDPAPYRYFFSRTVAGHGLLHMGHILTFDL